MPAHARTCSNARRACAGSSEAIFLCALCAQLVVVLNNSTTDMLQGGVTCRFGAPVHQRILS